MSRHASPSSPPLPRLLLAAPGSAAPSGLRPTRTRRAGWRIVVWLAALIGAVIAFSALLVPRGVERLLLHHVAGRPLDHASEVLEARYASGDRSTVLLEALARARMQRGEVAGSLELLPVLLAERPEDLEILGLLAQGYRVTRRERELRDVLERLQSLRPEAARQRELANLLQRVGTAEQHLQAQQVLVEQFDAGEVADYLIVAQRQRASGQAAAALANLDRMGARFPASLDVSVAVLQVSLLLQLGEGPAALERARRWLDDHRDRPDHAKLAIASALGSNGRPELAAAVLDPYCQQPTASTALLKVWAQAVSDSGHPALALVRLDAMGDRAELRFLRLRLALASARVEQALQIARQIGLEWVPDDSLLALAGVALAPQQAELLREMTTPVLRRIGAIDPLLAGQLALRRGDRPSALSWAQRADASDTRTGLRAVQWARLFEQLGELDRARTVLRRAPVEDTPSFPVTEWARLQVQLGLATEALPILRGALPARTDLATQESRALLAAAAGRQSEVTDWLGSEQGQRSEADFYRDLTHVAFDVRAERVAATAAERLRGRGITVADRRLIARAMSEAGRVEEALDQYRELRRRGEIDARDWQAHLVAAWRRGADVAPELRQESVALLKTADNTLRDASLEVLMELGAWNEVLPMLEGLALGAPQRWLGLLTQAAERSGSRTALQRVWVRLGRDESLESRLRAQLAFRLLESGDKVEAERIFRALATQAGPDDAATRQLLFLWGPRPAVAQLDWLERRAREAGGVTRLRWLELLQERGAGNRVLRIVDTVPLAQRDLPLVKLQLGALEASGARSALRAAILEQAESRPSLGLLEVLLRFVARAGDAVLETRLMEQAADAGSEDPRVWHAVGAARLARRELPAARQAFETALQALDASGESSVSARSLRANLLHRLGRVTEARALYETLLAERPNDDALRADFVSLLLALDQTGSAQAALDGRSR